MLIDSLILKGKMPTIPPYMKRGDRITVIFKVADLFTSDSAANADRAREMAVEQVRQQKESATEKVKEQKVVDAFIVSNKINAQKTANGVYVEIVKPGMGIQVDTGKIVSVKYRAMTFTGKTFDTNMDSSFHHPEPYEYPVGRGAVIPGLDEGVRLLKKGAKAKIYIPAVLAYGPNPVVEGGKPYENLIFEIEVLDVKDKPAVSKMPSPKLDTTQRKR
jgi:FKBP-type peptidyl-prolyl cis-trans isomerase